MKDWNLFKDIKPNIGEEVLAHSPLWIDEDRNPKGIRVGFLNESENGDFISARWWDYQDTYITDEETKPVFWKEIEDFSNGVLTKQDLIERGFVFKKQGGWCGQDQWVGMDFWIYEKNKDLVLRGNIRDLKLDGHFNSRIETKDELDTLINIFTRLI